MADTPCDRRNDSAADHRGQRTLNFGTRPGVQRHWQESQRNSERGHQDRTQTQPRAASDCVLDGGAGRGPIRVRSRHHPWAVLVRAMLTSTLYVLFLIPRPFADRRKSDEMPTYLRFIDRRSLTRVCGTVLGLGVLAHTGAAQDAPAAGSAAEAPAAPEIEEIVVFGRNLELLGTADAASEGAVGGADLLVRPMLRVAELLEAVPGLIAVAALGQRQGEPVFPARLQPRPRHGLHDLRRRHAVELAARTATARAISTSTA